MPDTRTDIDAAILRYLSGDVLAATEEAIHANVLGSRGTIHRSILRLRRGGWIRSDRAENGTACYYLREREEQVLAALATPPSPDAKMSLYAVLGVAEALALKGGLR